MLPIILAVRNRRQRNNNLLRINRRQLRDTTNPFNISEQRFIELYRLNQDMARFIINRLLNNIPAQRQQSISLEMQVLVTLRFLATGSYQRTIGQDFLVPMSQTSISRAIHLVVRAIENLGEEFIKFPVTPRAQEVVKNRFIERTGFPGIIGVVDGTHIALIPPKEEEHIYRNRKGFHSINALIISDYDLKILAVDANYPGSVHDSHIWRNSNIFVYLENQYNRQERQHWLLGDLGYPLQPWLLTPVQNAVAGSPEANYNQAHVLARNTVERCIGLLKSRFQCILQERTLRYSPNFATSLINCCCILHNLCLAADINVENEIQVIYENDNFQNIENNHYFNEGSRIRNNLIHRHFVNEHGE